MQLLGEDTGPVLLPDHDDVEEDADDEDLPLMTFGGM